MVDFPARSPETGPGTASRRSVLAGGVAGALGLALSACSIDKPDSGGSSPGAGRTPAGGSTDSAGTAPDVAVATTALAEIRAVRAATARTIARFPASRPQLATVLRMHRAHERSLADAVPEQARPSTAPAPYAVPRRRGRALDKLATREQRLHDTLDGLALRAESGDFARLLAAMGAGIHQQLAGWES